MDEFQDRILAQAKARQHEALVSIARERDDARTTHPEFAQRVDQWTPEQLSAVRETLMALRCMMITVSEDPSPELGGNPVVRATLLGVGDTLDLMRVVACG